MAVTPKIRRSYKGAPVSAVLGTAGVSSTTQTSITLSTSPSTWPTGKFFVVVAPGTVQEEKMCVTVSGSTMTVVDPSVSSTSPSTNGRGVDDTTARSTIAGGATVYPVATARDFDEANSLTATYANQGGIVYLGDPSFTQLAIGTAGQVLKVNSGATAPEWGQVAAAGIASDAVTTAKILDANVTLAKLATVLQNALPPVGTIAPYAGTSAPTGWLLCNGGAISGTYTGLIALVGANTPNLKGKFLVGLDSTVSDFDGLSNAIDSIGDTGGVATVTLTSAQSGVPAHSHPNTATASSTSTSTTSITDPTHRHSFSGTTDGTSITVDQGFPGTGGAAGFGTYTSIDATNSGANITNPHSHTFSGNTAYVGTGISASTSTSTSTTVTMSNQNNTTANAASAHTNVPPYYTVNYIIKHDYV